MHFDRTTESVFVRVDMIDEREAEIEKLRRELREAKAREEALLKAITMMSGGTGSA